jgi:hypothetical protein
MVSFIAQVAAGGYPGPDPVNVPVSLVVGLAGLALTAWNVVALWRDGRLRAGRREADMKSADRDDEAAQYSGSGKSPAV